MLPGKPIYMATNQYIVASLRQMPTEWQEQLRPHLQPFLLHDGLSHHYYHCMGPLALRHALSPPTLSSGAHWLSIIFEYGLGHDYNYLLLIQQVSHSSYLPSISLGYSMDGSKCHFFHVDEEFIRVKWHDNNTREG